MTKSEWLNCEEPRRLLDFLEGEVTARKDRLIQCACGRLISHLLPSDAWRDLIDVAERYADGEASEEERETRLQGAAMSRSKQVQAVVMFPLYKLPPDSRSALANTMYAAPEVVPKLCTVLRCLFNPFRSAFHNPAWFTSWFTSDVLALARGIYAERAFDRMPILADALQDAGCDNAEVLSHCRDANQIHVRGCWVVDLLLGKT